MNTVVSYRNSTSNHNYGRHGIVALYVVSYRNSTSNHNKVAYIVAYLWLYLIEILHQTTTGYMEITKQLPLYLIEILHQTTTQWSSLHSRGGCILSKFYIKPQLEGRRPDAYPVVSYRNSTSNHNLDPSQSCRVSVVSYRNSTSNHNFEIGINTAISSCILSKFYIKPQRDELR